MGFGRRRTPPKPHKLSLPLARFSALAFSAHLHYSCSTLAALAITAWERAYATQPSYCSVAVGGRVTPDARHPRQRLSSGLDVAESIRGASAHPDAGAGACVYASFDPDPGGRSRPTHTGTNGHAQRATGAACWPICAARTIRRVDLDELGFALGGDAETIIDWVRQNISFQQYPGMLRGAYGTLITRPGNALDQAMLLARLLGDAGYEIRIARGKLE